MQAITVRSKRILNNLADTYDLSVAIEYASLLPLSYRSSISDEFAALVNDDACVRNIEAAADVSGLKRFWLEQPMPWSEDFAFYALFFFSKLGPDSVDLNVHAAFSA